MESVMLTHSISEPRETPNGLCYDAQFTLRPDCDKRSFIQRANESVDIVTFDRALPSMNEIFIRAVEASNHESTQK
jgi:hypothetical protein